MAESAGSLTFGFDADFTGFNRAAASAGDTLDRLARQASQWADATSAGVGRSLDGAAGLATQQGAALDAAGRAMATRARSLAGAVVAPNGLSAAQVLAGTSIKDTSGDRDDNSAQVLTKLSEQLALLTTTGAAHDEIIDRMKIEVAQAKLGADATTAEKDAVAGLVTQIDAAAAAQAKLKAAQDATNQAWGFGSQQALQGIDSLIFDGAKLGDVTAGILRNLSEAGLAGALTGTGPFAGVFGTLAPNGATGGLFGAIGKAVTGSGSSPSSFAGLFAEGGSIGPGQWGIVGEKGAEVVAGPAAVTPWSKVPAASARTTQVINFNVTSPDAPSFARSESQMAALLSRAVGRGQRNL